MPASHRIDNVVCVYLKVIIYSICYIKMLLCNVIYVIILFKLRMNMHFHRYLKSGYYFYAKKT